MMEYVMKWAQLTQDAKVAAVRRSLRVGLVQKNHDVDHLYERHICRTIDFLWRRCTEAMEKEGFQPEAPHLKSRFSYFDRENKKTVLYSTEAVLSFVTRTIVDRLDEIEEWMASDKCLETYSLTVNMKAHVGDALVGEVLDSRGRYKHIMCDHIKIVLKPNTGRFQKGEKLPFFMETAFPTVSEARYEELKAEARAQQAAH